jgi:hypothetical protein
MDCTPLNTALIALVGEIAGMTVLLGVVAVVIAMKDRRS